MAYKEAGRISSDEYFIYELIEYENQLCWKIRAKDDLRKFKCKSVYEGYPVSFMQYTFSTCNHKSIDISEMDASNIVSLKSAFDSNMMIESIDISNWDLSKVTDFRLAFYGCTSLQEIKLPTQKLGENIDFYSMFYSCSELKQIDMSGIQPQSIKRLYRMFSGCHKLEYLDIRNLSFINDETRISDIHTIFENDLNLKCIILKDKQEAEYIADSLENMNISPYIMPFEKFNQNTLAKMQLLSSSRTCICAYCK